MWNGRYVNSKLECKLQNIILEKGKSLMPKNLLFQKTFMYKYIKFMCTVPWYCKRKTFNSKYLVVHLSSVYQFTYYSYLIFLINFKIKIVSTSSGHWFEDLICQYLFFCAELFIIYIKTFCWKYYFCNNCKVLYQMLCSYVNNKIFVKLWLINNERFSPSRFFLSLTGISDMVES